MEILRRGLAVISEYGELEINSDELINYYKAMNEA